MRPVLQSQSMKRSMRWTADRGRAGIPPALVRGWNSRRIPADCGRCFEEEKPGWIPVPVPASDVPDPRPPPVSGAPTPGPPGTLGTGPRSQLGVRLELRPDSERPILVTGSVADAASPLVLPASPQGEVMLLLVGVMDAGGLGGREDEIEPGPGGRGGCVTPQGWYVPVGWPDPLGLGLGLPTPWFGLGAEEPWPSGQVLPNAYEAGGACTSRAVGVPVLSGVPWCPPRSPR